MAGEKALLTKPVEELLEKIEKKFSPERIVLFGSRATKEYFNYSDWDLLIVSERFEGYSFRERIDAVLELCTQAIGQDVEPLCFTPEEIDKRKKELGIVRTALESGITLKTQ